MKEDMEYHLNDPGNIEIEKGNNKYKKIIITLISIIIILIIIIIVGITLYFTSGKKEENKENDSNKETEYQEFNIYINISTSENNMIRNSFKEGGKNYIPEWGNINNGSDYIKNERNNFDLCIPKSVLQNKTNYKTIVLDIHGGGWMKGYKADVVEGCKS